MDSETGTPRGRPDWNTMKLSDLFGDDATIDTQAKAVAVSGLAVDSRAVKPGDLFFALSGTKTDGARFIDAAIAAGAVAVAGDHRPTGGNVIARIAPLLGIEPRFDLPPSDRLILAASRTTQ